tara:strand:+ start:135 stop:380 length:246 start_codon:yes stop_codon:yes gene_type:complete
VTNFDKKLLGVALATLISIIGYIVVELANLRANVQEEIGRSEEIDKKHEQWLLSTSNRTLLTLERVTRLEAKDGIYHNNNN